MELFSCDARASDLPKYVAALHRTELDYFGVSETEVELAEWIWAAIRWSRLIVVMYSRAHHLII